MSQPTQLQDDANLSALEIGDNESVYEETYQNIKKSSNPLWRAHKLSKRIKYDRRIDIGERRHL